MSLANVAISIKYDVFRAIVFDLVDVKSKGKTVIAHTCSDFVHTLYGNENLLCMFCANTKCKWVSWESADKFDAECGKERILCTSCFSDLCGQLMSKGKAKLGVPDKCSLCMQYNRGKNELKIIFGQVKYQFCRLCVDRMFGQCDWERVQALARDDCARLEKASAGKKRKLELAEEG